MLKKGKEDQNQKEEYGWKGRTEELRREILELNKKTEEQNKKTEEQNKKIEEKIQKIEDLLVNLTVKLT